jgi:hypothetical protein
VAITSLDPSAVFAAVTTSSADRRVRSRAWFSARIQISLVRLSGITWNVPMVVVSTTCCHATTA